MHEYAWLGDENSGGFKELDLDEDPRMKSLRYKLENVDLKLLNELAGSAGVGPKTLQSIHSSDHPKQDIINALMEIARMEGDEKGQKSKGTVAKVFGFSTPVEKMESEDGKSSPNRKSEFHMQRLVTAFRAHHLVTVLCERAWLLDPFSDSE